MTAQKKDGDSSILRWVLILASDARYKGNSGIFYITTARYWISPFLNA